MTCYKDILPGDMLVGNDGNWLCIAMTSCAPPNVDTWGMYGVSWVYFTWMHHKHGVQHGVQVNGKSTVKGYQLYRRFKK